MVIPQFSLRWILAVTTGLSLVFLVMSLAVRGQGWAIGVSVAFISLAVVMTLHAAFFGLIWILSLMQAAIRRQPPPPVSATVRAAASPFASDGRTAASPPLQGPAR